MVFRPTIMTANAWYGLRCGESSCAVRQEQRHGAWQRVSRAGETGHRSGGNWWGLKRRRKRGVPALGAYAADVGGEVVAASWAQAGAGASRPVGPPCDPQRGDAGQGGGGEEQQPVWDRHAVQGCRREADEMAAGAEVG